MRHTQKIALALATAAALVGCKKTNPTDSPQGSATGAPATAEDAATAPLPSMDAAAFALPEAPPLPPTPLGLPPTPSPEYNVTTAEKVALGLELFSEAALSASGETRCALCHSPEHGFSTPEQLNKTASGAMNQRHTPALVNIGYHSEFYWDGRSAPLEGHILGHWEGQLGLSPASAIANISESPKYIAHFERAFGSAPHADRATEALAAYIRTLRVGNTPWDRYEAGDTSAVSKDAIAGAEIFNKRAGCATCHAPPLYTDLRYHDLKLPPSDPPDVGRQAHSGHVSDAKAFKTPTLRGVSQSAPYFHNGSAATLGEVLDHKESQGSPRLSQRERVQLLAFVAALSTTASP